MEQSQRIVLENEPLQLETIEQQNEPESIVMRFDSSLFEKEKDRYETTESVLRQLQAEFSNLNYGPLELEKIPDLIEDTTEFIFKAAIKNSPLTIGDLKISESHIRTMIELSDYSGVELQVKVLKNVFCLLIGTKNQDV